MTTVEELLKKPLAVAAEDPEEVQRLIDSHLAELAQLRQLLAIAKAGAKPGRKRAPSPRKRKAAETVPAANGESE